MGFQRTQGDSGGEYRSKHSRGLPEPGFDTAMDVGAELGAVGVLAALGCSHSWRVARLTHGGLEWS